MFNVEGISHTEIHRILRIFHCYATLKLEFNAAGARRNSQKNVESLTFNVEYSLLLTLALEGSQLHATEGAEVDERKTFKVEGLTNNIQQWGGTEVPSTQFVANKLKMDLSYFDCDKHSLI